MELSWGYYDIIRQSEDFINKRTIFLKSKINFINKIAYKWYSKLKKDVQRRQFHKKEKPQLQLEHFVVTNESGRQMKMSKLQRPALFQHFCPRTCASLAGCDFETPRMLEYDRGQQCGHNKKFDSLRTILASLFFFFFLNLSFY